MILGSTEKVTCLLPVSLPPSPSPSPTNHILSPSVRSSAKLFVLAGRPAFIVLHTQVQEGLQVRALIRWREAPPDLSYSQLTTFQVVSSLCRRQWVSATLWPPKTAAEMSADLHLQTLQGFMQ